MHWRLRCDTEHLAAVKVARLPSGFQKKAPASTLYETAKVWRALVPATTPEGTGGGPGCGEGALDKGRLEAFSDGVIAIIITIMVLELKAPHGADLGALIALASAFLSYVLSFLYVAIYWHNHHHLLKVHFKVDGRILWANTHLLFWLSLIPFATAWLDESHFAPIPTAIYGVSLLMPAVAFSILQAVIIRAQGRDSELRKALGADWKGKVSIVAYMLAIVLAFVDPRLPLAVYVLIALLWLVPDRRIEKWVRHES